ncbi:MAG TPA: hypothetical protein VNA20_02830 [Frankiaceae bacterium]|nr:hypothetical protein [Frankiaceae bacterium]
MPVRLSSVDLDRRTAVVRVADAEGDDVPHALRGTLAALLHEPTWHVVVAFERCERDLPLRPELGEVLDQARGWAAERDCRLSVTPLRDVRQVTRLG